MLLGGHPVSVVYMFSQFFCCSLHGIFRVLFCFALFLLGFIGFFEDNRFQYFISSWCLLNCMSLYLLSFLVQKFKTLHNLLVTKFKVINELLAIKGLWPSIVTDLFYFALYDCTLFKQCWIIVMQRRKEACQSPCSAMSLAFFPLSARGLFLSLSQFLYQCDNRCHTAVTSERDKRWLFLCRFPVCLSWADLEVSVWK